MRCFRHASMLNAIVLGLTIAIALPVAQAAGENPRPGKKAQQKKAVVKPRVPTRHMTPASHGEQVAVMPGLPAIKSMAALVVDMNDDRTLYDKNPRSVTPIASITKLMTAMVMLDAQLPLDELITISTGDLDFVKNTQSRLVVGTSLPRRDMLKLALMSSENRAASAIGRSYPGGGESFVVAMNQKAADLGMSRTRFTDATGLSSGNVSTAEDLVKMVKAAYGYPLIREYTTAAAHGVEALSGRSLQYGNSNGLVKSSDWDIGLSKTGFISEAGRCLVMQAKIAARPVVIVLLDSWGRHTRTADAIRIKKWLESVAGRGLLS